MIKVNKDKYILDLSDLGNSSTHKDILTTARYSDPYEKYRVYILASKLINTLININTDV